MKKVNNKIILILTIILILLLMLGLIADARYQTILSGTGSASIANWSFKVIDADPQTTDIIELAVTRTDGSDKVVEGKLAPGTYGEFEIGIDARGTETVVEYAIDISLENAPRNLVFYSNSERTRALTIENATVTKKGYMTLEEVNEIRTEKIYWEWPYETGATDDEKLANNIEDTEDAGKDVTMQITVTGTQVLEEPTVESGVKLGTLNLGDYVDAGTMLLDDVTGVVMEKYEGNKQAEWRVAKKEGDTVTLILSDYLPNRHLSSISGMSLHSNGYTVGWPDLADAYEAEATLTNSDNWKSLLIGSKIEDGTIVGGLTVEDFTKEFKSVTNMFTPHTLGWNGSSGYWYVGAYDSYEVGFVYREGDMSTYYFAEDTYLRGSSRSYSKI